MASFKAPWGILCIIDAAECDSDAINSYSDMQLFIDELLTTIEMVKIGGLNLNWCDTNDPAKSGISMYQLLQDSNVSAHFCPNDRNSAYLDLFSCKQFDPNEVKAIFKKYFNPQKIHMTTIARQAPD